MRRSPHRGGSLSEYAVMLGLIALVSMAALRLLGHSTQDLLGGVTTGQTGQQLNDLISLRFQGVNASMAQPPVSNAALPATNPSSPSLGLTESSGGGVNVSSTEGVRVNIPNVPPSLNSALTTAQQFDQLANNTSNPAAAVVYQQIANQSYFLASTQASYEIHVNGQDNPSLKSLANAITNQLPTDVARMNITLKAIDNGMSALEQSKKTISDNKDLTTAEKKEALLMIDATITASQEQYGNTMRNNSLYKTSPAIEPPTESALENLRNIAINASISGELVEHTAVNASVETGLHLDQK